MKSAGAIAIEVAWALPFVVALAAALIGSPQRYEQSEKPRAIAVLDWAMLEALEEVDRIGWAAAPVARPGRAGTFQLIDEPITARADKDMAMAAVLFCACEFCGLLRPSEELELYSRCPPLKYRRCQACRRGHEGS